MPDTDMGETINAADAFSPASSSPAIVASDIQDAASGGGGGGSGPWSIPDSEPRSEHVLVKKPDPSWSNPLSAECDMPASVKRKRMDATPYPRVRRHRDMRNGNLIRFTTMRPADYLHTARERLRQMKQATGHRRWRERATRLIATSSTGPGPSQGSLVRFSPTRSHSRSPGLVLIDSPEHGPFYIPLLHPPINRHTLKELEIETILVNPQLRAFFLWFLK